MSIFLVGYSCVSIPKVIGCGFSDVQVTRPTPVSSRRVMSTQSARWTSGRARESASAMLDTSAWKACPVRVSVSCGLTFASMTASVTSSPARAPSAGGWGKDQVVCGEGAGFWGQCSFSTVHAYEATFWTSSYTAVFVLRTWRWLMTNRLKAFVHKHISYFPPHT